MTDIPVWYKQTEIGIIPNDWNVKCFWNIWDVLMCKRIMKYQTSTHWEIPFYKISTFWNTADVFINRNLFEEYKRKYSYPKKWDILISAAWTIWRTVVFDGRNSYFQDSNIVRINNKETIVLNSYLYYIYKIVKWKTEDWGIVLRLYNQNLKDTQFVCPSNTDEQQAIATTLSDMDELISNLDELIEKKKNIKKWAMQKLLSPKENREHKKLWDICNFIKWRWLSKDKIVDNWENECLLYWELFTTYSYIIEKIESRTNSLEGNPSKEWDVLIPGSTTTVWIDLAKASALLKEWVLLGWDINILRRKNKSEYNSAFLAYYLTEQQKYNIAMQAQWITIIHLYWRNLEDIDVYMPKDIEEQNSIVTILSDMDKEIEALEEKKAKYEQIKQWAMQKLLTGKIRLV